MTNQRVADILTQPVYTGHICSKTYGVDWLKAQHEPLISVETFDKAQTRRQGAAYAPQRKNIGHDFALRGFICCADCATPLRSSWVKGRSKHYAYYLCQTKSCEAYGKSTPRDKVENDVGALIKDLQPTEDLFKLARAMFRCAWDARRDQAKDMIKSAKRQLADLDKQIDKLLTRVMDSATPAVIQTYEAKIAGLEREKILLSENLTNQTEPRGAFDEKLELSLQFLANPWKLWKTGQVTLRRAVLKLAFEDRLHYCRNGGARTPKNSLSIQGFRGSLRG